MKKTFLKLGCFMLAAVMSIGMLSGCGANDDAQDGKVTISVAGAPDRNTDEDAWKTWEEKVKKFNEIYPDIEVVGDTYSFNAETFYAKAEGESLPTLYQVPFTESEKVIKFGYASPVTKQFRDAGFYDNINSYVLDRISRDGEVYLIPKEVYSMGLAMNMDYMKQAGLVEEDGTPMAPKTMQEMAETAVKLKEATGKAGIIFPTTNNGGGWFFTVLAWNFGANFMQETEDGWVATLNSPECVKALEYMKDLKWKYDVLPESTLISNGDLMQMFGAGNAGMSFAPPNFCIMFTAYGLSKDALGMANIPTATDTNVTLMGGTYWAVSNTATDAQIDAVLKWVEYEGVTMEMSEETKENMIADRKYQQEEGIVIGLKDINIWKDGTEMVQYKNQLIDEYINVNPNHVKLYNNKEGITFRGEEPACAQDLYGVLDSCIQEVLTNENADCQSLLEKANNDFQHNFLDYEN